MWKPIDQTKHGGAVYPPGSMRTEKKNQERERVRVSERVQEMMMVVVGEYI